MTVPDRPTTFGLLMLLTLAQTTTRAVEETGIGSPLILIIPLIALGIFVMVVALGFLAILILALMVHRKPPSRR